MVSQSFSRAALVGAVLTMSLVFGACQSSTVTPTPAGPQNTANQPVPTATPTPTPVPTATPTPTPTPTPTTPPPGPCSPNGSTNQWWIDQAAHLSFDVYCWIMPSGWGLVSATSSAGVLQAHYKNSAGHTIDVWEGNVCAASPNPCSGNWPTSYGPGQFGPLTGEVNGPDLWMIIVHTSNPKVTYTMEGSGMNQTTFRTYAAAMHKVP